jgi:hypothetical protein
MSKSRSERASHLLDITIEQLTKKIEGGEVSAGTLREVLALARAAGVDLAREGQPMSSAARRFQDGIDLSCLDDVDPSILDVN